MTSPMKLIYACNAALNTLGATLLSVINPWFALPNALLALLFAVLLARR